MEPKLVEKDLQRSLISSKIAQQDVQFTKYNISCKCFLVDISKFLRKALLLL